MSRKPKEQLLEYAAYYAEPSLSWLLLEKGYEKAKAVRQIMPTVIRKYLLIFETKNLREVLSLVEQYGVDHRNMFNQTPLMCAARQGNPHLVETLIAKGANSDLTDNYGKTAFQQALVSAIDPQFAKMKLGLLYPLLAPASVSLCVNDRLVKLDAHTMEYFIFNVMLSLMHSYLNAIEDYNLYSFEGFTTADFLNYTDSLPDNVLTEQRKKRTYLSSVLSRNEIDRDYAYNRRIFIRLRTGHYTLNPALKVLKDGGWVDLHEYLGFNFLNNRGWPKLQNYLERLKIKSKQ